MAIQQPRGRATILAIFFATGLSAFGLSGDNASSLMFQNYPALRQSWETVQNSSSATKDELKSAVAALAEAEDPKVRNLLFRFKPEAFVWAMELKPPQISQVPLLAEALISLEYEDTLPSMSHLAEQEGAIARIANRLHDALYEGVSTPKAPPWQGCQREARARWLKMVLDKRESIQAMRNDIGGILVEVRALLHESANAPIFKPALAPSQIEEQPTAADVNDWTLWSTIVLVASAVLIVWGFARGRKNA